MTITLEEVSVKIGADTGALKTAEKELIAFSESIDKTFADGLKKLNRKIVDSQKKITFFSTNFKTVTNSLTASMEKLNRSLERTKTALSTLDERFSSTKEKITEAARSTDNFSSGQRLLLDVVKNLAVSLKELKSKTVQTAINMAEARAASSDLTQGVGKLGKRVEETSGKTKALTMAIKALKTAVKTLGVFLIAKFVKSLLKVADVYRGLEIRVKTATRGTDDFTKSFKELNRISVNTSSSLKDNVNLFQTLSLIKGDLHTTNDEILKVIQSISQLGRISGSSVDAMKAGLLQLSNGFAGVAFNSIEMNSILEHIPLIAKKIADSFGITVGQIRKLTPKKLLLSEDVFKALLVQADEVNEQFTEVPKTISTASVSLQNSFSRLIGDIDKVLGATSAIADGFIQLSKEMDSMDFKGFVEALGTLKDALVVTGSSIIDFIPPLKFLRDELRKGRKLRDDHLDYMRRMAKKTKNSTFEVEGLTKSFKRLNQAVSEQGLAGIIPDNIQENIPEIDIMSALFPKGFTEAESEMDRLKRQLLEKGQEMVKELTRIEEEKALKDEARRLKEEQKKIAAAEKELKRVKKLEDDLEKAFVSRLEKEKDARLKLEQSNKDSFMRQLNAAAKYSEEAFLLQKALAIKEIALNATKAASAAFAYGSSIGGPALGAVFKAISYGLSAAEGYQVATASFNSGRRAGGQVSQGSTYRVNESGTEFYSDGKNDYLLAGENGRLSSNASSSKVSVVVNNNTPAQVQVMERRRPNQELSIDLIIDTVENALAGAIYSGDGALSTSLEEQYGLNRSTRLVR